MSETNAMNPGHRPDREGFALVTTVLVVLVLSVLAVAVVWIASSEKKTSFAEGVHVSALFSADAGGEAAINFLRVADHPPQIVDFADSTVRVQPTTTLQTSQSFTFDTRYKNWEERLGWDPNYYRDYNYEIGATGRASLKGQSDIDVVASRLFKVGY